MLKNISEELKNKYKESLADVWKTKEMREYCFKETDYLVELSSGKIIPLERPTIKKDFCFGYGMYANYEDEELNQAEDMVEVASTNEEYFKKKNLETLEELIQDLKEAKYVATYRKYYSQGEKNLLVNYSAYKNEYYMQEAKNDNRLEGFEIISESDIDRIIDGLELVKQAFEKRITAYIKRYGTSKVNAWSYLRD